MRITLRQLWIIAVSVIGAAAITGCATNPYYRTYYQDPQCRIFYVDGNGNRVYENGTGMGSRACSVGRDWCRDGNGRLYYKDSFGNVVYKSRCDK